VSELHPGSAQIAHQGLPFAYDPGRNPLPGILEDSNLTPLCSHKTKAPAMSDTTAHSCDRALGV